MKVKFWGVRGSVPTPITTAEIRGKTRKVLEGAAGIDLGDSAAIEAYLDSLSVFQLGTVGGNSSCVEVRAGDELLIFDAGTGIRALGLDLMKKEFGLGKGTAHILLGHTHWDHIMGFPFFTPAYIPGNRIRFYGMYDNLEQRIRDQQSYEHFPVSLDEMPSEKEFIFAYPTEEIVIGELSVTPFIMYHPGGACGYRVEYNGKVFVYASDTEFSMTKEGDTIYLKDADILILDTMYSFEDVIAKENWGHCSPFIGVDISHAENVKRLILFHHEPAYSDMQLMEILEKTMEYRDKMYPGSSLEIQVAYEGLTINLGNAD